jgi:hypothetical protein
MKEVRTDYENRARASEIGVNVDLMAILLYCERKHIINKYFFLLNME